MTSLPEKYRPAKFDDVVGQDDTVRSLKRVVKDGRGKVFLFTGPSGCGKTTLARILANEFAGGKATAANIDEVPAADHTGVDDMRAVAGRALYRAVGGSPVKAIIIDEAHRLSGNAWDVLLKPVEEPPRHVYWMFATTNPGKIPKTIITRCLRYDLKPVSETLIVGLLETVAEAEGLDVAPEVLEAVAEGAGGSPRQALTYLEACIYAESAGEARQLMRSAGQTKEVVDLCRFLLKGQGRSWSEAIKILKALEGTEAESIRIVVCNYIAAALMGTKDQKNARKLLGLLECFNTPYQQSDRLAPLLSSLGLALELDR